LSNGYDVDPDALRTASNRFYDSSDAVGDAAALLALTQLVPQALGEVPAADELSAAVSRFVGAHGDDLRHGSIWINDAADGLVQSADSYRRHDDASADRLRALREPQ
jgi:hypothetical protein